MYRMIRDSNVCIVGGAGFLGSHLVNHLIEDRDCEVLVIDNLITGLRKFIHHKAAFEHADITQSEEYLYKLFKAYQVRYVFNYAAEPYVPKSFERPLHVFNINAFGALKVINAAQEAGCEAILQVSSAEIYGGPSGPYPTQGSYNNPNAGKMGRINEDTLVEPHSSYGASKAAIDAMVQVRWREAQTPCIALRQFNCIGERETHPYVVPEIISQIYERGFSGVVGNPRIRLGNNSSRDFLYAGDAVRMATELLERGEFGEVYNMGSQDSIRIYDLAKLIGTLMGFAGSQEVEVIPDEKRVRPWEIWSLCSSNEKLYSVIQNRPQVSLEEALQRTITYFRQNGNRWDWNRT